MLPERLQRKPKEATISRQEMYARLENSYMKTHDAMREALGYHPDNYLEDELDEEGRELATHWGPIIKSKAMDILDYYKSDPDLSRHVLPQVKLEYTHYDADSNEYKLLFDTDSRELKRDYLEDDETVEAPETDWIFAAGNLVNRLSATEFSLGIERDNIARDRFKHAITGASVSVIGSHLPNPVGEAALPVALSYMSQIYVAGRIKTAAMGFSLASALEVAQKSSSIDGTFNPKTIAAYAVGTSVYYGIETALGKLQKRK